MVFTDPLCPEESALPVTKPTAEEAFAAAAMAASPLGRGGYRLVWDAALAYAAQEQEAREALLVECTATLREASRNVDSRSHGYTLHKEATPAEMMWLAAAIALLARIAQAGVAPSTEGAEG